MKNPRITDLDTNLIKGALRRVFARSELHKKVLNLAVAPSYTDPARPRVKTWCKCPICDKYDARSYFDVDHHDPVIPINKSMKDLTIEEFIDRLWCEESNLKAICTECHDRKTKIEGNLRREYKKRSKIT
jgi:hypothetical protein